MISLALLIGGRGERLGGLDKATLVLPSGRTTAETLLQTFQPLVADAFAVGRADQTTHPLSRSMPIVSDDLPAQGPLRGIATALSATRTPWVFVVACDLVDLTPDALTQLAAERGRARLAIAWQSPDGPEPLCALYHRALATTARNLLARGERRARSLLAHAHFLARPSGVPNINTAADVARL